MHDFYSKKDIKQRQSSDKLPTNCPFEKCEGSFIIVRHVQYINVIYYYIQIVVVVVIFSHCVRTFSGNLC